MAPTAPPPTLAKIQTQVPGLDQVLGGGIIRGSVTIVQGTPGAGKTTLANQIAFNQARENGRVIYVTLLAESHARMAQHMSSFDFFDSKAIGPNVRYFSGYSELLEHGSTGLLRLVTREARALKADVVIIDGLFIIGDACPSENEFRKFINDLAIQAELLDCCIILLTNSRRPSSSPEYTMVDAWWELVRESSGVRAVRNFEVHKLRGSDFISGRHTAELAKDGVRILPRVEGTFGMEAPENEAVKRQSVGVAFVDAAIAGGIPGGSSTLLIGPTGVGKTTFGLHFVSEADHDGPALFMGFYETPTRIMRSAIAQSLELERVCAEGHLELLWRPSTENRLDEIGHDLLERVQRRGVRRLFVDGLQAFELSTDASERMGRFMSALTHELHRLGCASVFTAESRSLTGGEDQLPFGATAAVVDNVIRLRYLPNRPRHVREFSVVKMRDTAFDASATHYVISSAGLQPEHELHPPHAAIPGRGDVHVES